MRRYHQNWMTTLPAWYATISASARTIQSSRTAPLVGAAFINPRLHGGYLPAVCRWAHADSRAMLEWDTFDFCSTPKLDGRFDTSRILTAKSDEEYATIIQKESAEDAQLATRQQKQNEAWESLDPSLVQEASLVLSKYVNADRIARIRHVLDQRTVHCRFLFENPANPSNAWACLRTLDSFGIQQVDAVIRSDHYIGRGALTQKRGMRTAMGSAQWLTVTIHPSTAAAVRELRRQQPTLRIYATDVSPKSRDVREIDWGDTPICIVMGNENDGISEEMRKMADETFYLPVSFVLSRLMIVL
jgi:tRNA G18 (ribose-2'-O)-methylase SpoU